MEVTRRELLKTAAAFIPASLLGIAASSLPQANSAVEPEEEAEKIEQLKAILREEAEAVLGARRWYVNVLVSAGDSSLLVMYVDVVEKQADGRYPVYSNTIDASASEQEMRLAAKAAMSELEYWGLYEIRSAVAKQ